MRLGTLFSGIGSPEQGASRVYDDLDLVFACEWDKFARESFNANYEIEDKHFHKDINDMDGTQYKNKVDILIGGSPCQDFSLAGLRAGIDGNKGILIYQYIRIIKEVQPPIFIYENVKGMLSDKGGRTIKEFVQAFRDMGYHCHYEVLNTKDYGVPQNRDRIFLVGFKDREHYFNFAFAPGITLEKRLKDVLEDQVEEKYYIPEEKQNLFIPGNKHLDNTLKKTQSNRISETSDISSTICAMTHGYSGGYINDTRLVIAGHLNTGSKYREQTQVISDESVSPTLLTCTGGNREHKIFQKGLVRKFTPREYFRLQDFPDTFKFVVSNSQLYKQSGNSISVNVIEMIFIQIEKSRLGNTDKGSLF